MKREYDGSRLRLEEILELTGAIVWEVNIEEMSVEFFGPVERVKGIPRTELHDPDAIATKTVHPDDQLALAEAFEAAMSGGDQHIDTEYRTHPDNGPVRWIRTQSYIADGADGHPVTLVGLSTDITRLKTQEARLEEFSSIVSHDLRNPLSVARGRLELAKDEVENQHLEPVETALDRMDSLIENLLMLARGGEIIGEKEPVALSNLAAEAWENLCTGEASLVVATEQTIQADRSRLQQLLENLFRNAVEHGGRDVTVTIDPLDDGFLVEDDGVGIPAAKRDTLFQDIGGVTSDSQGLGLQIVSQIVTAHSWEIQAKEAESGGACFEISNTQLVGESPSC